MTSTLTSHEATKNLPAFTIPDAALHVLTWLPRLITPQDRRGFAVRIASDARIWDTAESPTRAAAADSAHQTATPRDLSPDASDSPTPTETGKLPLTIALSARLRCGFVDGAGHVITNQDLLDSGLRAQEVWDLAASNLLALGSDAEGIVLRIAPYQRGTYDGGLWVRFPETNAPAWLAHPHTFQPVDAALRQLIGADLCYLLPDDDMLLAVPRHRYTPRALSEWLKACDAPKTLYPIICDQGFPQHQTY